MSKVTGEDIKDLEACLKRAQELAQDIRECLSSLKAGDTSAMLDTKMAIAAAGGFFFDMI